MDNQMLNRLYSVDIVETLHRVVTVAALDAVEAHRIANDCWKKGDIVLSAEDFESVEFTAQETRTAQDIADNTVGYIADNVEEKIAEKESEDYV